MEERSGYYFEDGIRTTDFVLVYNKNKLNQLRRTYLETFVENLTRAGFGIEITPLSLDKNISFIKIHGSPTNISIASILLDETFSSSRPNRKHLNPSTPHIFTNVLTNPSENDNTYIRIRENFAGENTQTIPSSEKIYIIHTLLKRLKFGDDKYDFGIPRLLNKKVLIDMFCLHDGPYEWTEKGPLNDCQLLYKFWGNLKQWYKIQPIHLIEKYFGTEYAFYFTWLGFYNKMLIIASVLSFLSIMYGLVTLGTTENQKSFEVCKSQLLLCPKCHYKNCGFQKLSSSCFYSYLVYIFDNRSTFVLSIAIACWATIFIELWKRKQAILQMQWSADNLRTDKTARVDYIDMAKKYRISEISNHIEPYVSFPDKFFGQIIAVGSIIILLGIMLSGAVAIMMYRVTIMVILVRDKTQQIITENVGLIAGITGSILSSIFVNSFTVLYRILAWYLTHLEKHRLQENFDLSYIYKSFALAITSHYVTSFYIAFLKGQFYTYPGDATVWNRMGGLAADTCDPTGCVLDLSLSLLCLMGGKIFYSNVAQILLPNLKNQIYLMYNYSIRSTKHLPVIEQEYLKPEAGEFFLMDEYSDMMIQFGFLSFFVAGFPIAPILALVNNLIELRVDAMKMLTIFRRPLPKRVEGLGTWLHILKGMTFFGIISNSAIIAYTSDFVPKEIYRYTTHSDLIGISNNTISEYAIDDFDIILANAKAENITDSCYYVGRRNPPESENPYVLKDDFWFFLALRIMIFLIIEGFVRFVSGLIAYAIPDVPEIVTQEKIAQEREARLKLRSKNL